MAFYRTALRLATIESLRPSALFGTQGPWPTLAKNRVYDTRIDPIEDLAKHQHAPVIAVYTESDSGKGSQYRGGPPFDRHVDLVFEISQIAKEPTEEDPNVYVSGYAYSDPELEAELDRVETEIYFALMFATNGATIMRGRDRVSLWQWLTGLKVTEPRSMPHRSSEEGARLAIRTVTWRVQVPDDVFESAPREERKGVDRLPEPLRSIATELVKSPAGASLLGGLADGMPTMPVARQLKSIGLNVEIIPPGHARTGTANMSALIGFPLWRSRDV